MNKKLVVWTARIAGLIVIVAFVLFFVDQEVRSYVRHTSPGALNFLPWLIAGFLGYLLAWFKPLPGGRLAILAGILMVCFHVNRMEWPMAVLYALPLISIGILFVVSHPGQQQRPEDSMP